jgi:hypothetical protein
MGNGRVGGSVREDNEVNDKFVEERPCNVNGRSRSNDASGGFKGGRFWEKKFRLCYCVRGSPFPIPDERTKSSINFFSILLTTLSFR